LELNALETLNALKLENSVASFKFSPALGKLVVAQPQSFASLHFEDDEPVEIIITQKDVYLVFGSIMSDFTQLDLRLSNPNGMDHTPVEADRLCSSVILNYLELS